MKSETKTVKGVSAMNKKGIGIMCLATMLLTGCGAALPDMTDEDANAIGEYAAITLLKYDANSRSRLVDLSQIEQSEEAQEPSVTEPSSAEPLPEEQPSAEPLDLENTPVTDTNTSEPEMADSLESFFELPEGVSLLCTGYEFTQSYEGEENTHFALEATEGKELLVLQFTMQNQSGSSQEINIFDRRDNYRVSVNASDTRTALSTMLIEDLSTYKGALPDGGTEKLVLVFELEAAQTGSVESIVLSLKNDVNSYTIQVL